jgi:nucleoside phosphorylase
MPFFSNKKIGILAAVPDEVKSILNNPQFKWEKIKTNFYKSPQNIYLMMSEIGKAYAVHGVSQLLPLCDEILMLGTSGRRFRTARRLTFGHDVPA